MGSGGLFLGLGSGPQATEGDAVSDSLPERPELALVPDFVAASVGGRMRRAAEILRADPALADRSLLAASVLGDAAAVRQHLADPATAVAIDDERGWPPLLYACYSRWHQIDPGRAPGLAEVVRLLLAAGAGADTNDGGRPRFRSALKGSVEVNNPEITEVLLAAGANPDLGQPVADAAGQRDLRCLRLLLARGARVAGTWAIGAAVFNDQPGAIALLLAALAAGGGQGTADAATEALPEAAATASFPVVAALLDAGADPRAVDDDGVSALRLAVRAGKGETAARLRALGAAGDDTDVDRFLGACLSGDRPAAERLLAGHPDLPSRMTDGDRAVIWDAAASGPAETLALMLDLGFSPYAARFGEQPLHNAAYHGNVAAVRLLLAAGAGVDARDARFDATPLAFATVGSGEQVGQPGGWTETVRLLVDAGACLDGVWVSGKPPSEEVAELLLRYGVTPAETTIPQQPDDQDEDEDRDERPGLVGTGVMAEIARQLETACRDLDLDLLGSLLDPEVRWTGLCRDRAQVLDWYRHLIAEGTVATVRSAEVDRDAVILRLAVSRRAEGARPAPPQQLYQVFTVDGARIVEIRGYGDRASALARGGPRVTAQPEGEQL